MAYHPAGSRWGTATLNFYEDRDNLRSDDGLASGFRAFQLRYGVARGTVRQAIAVLRDRDLVVTVQGRGTYVKA